MRIIGSAVMLCIAVTLGTKGQNPRPAQVSPTSIGLAVGQKAPAFEALDQFGRTQTSETLKGPQGTVLLFFRSADW